MSSNNNKIPITILTGYLGSGKTTLLHHILTQKPSLKIAILLNEFHPIPSLEHHLTLSTSSTSSTQTILQLPNGCMCCTLKHPSLQAIETMLTTSGPFDHIVIETTGLADPGPICNMFWVDEALESSVYLDGVVCVVDCWNESNWNEVEMARQIGMGDVVVVNKCDLVEVDRLEIVKSRIRELNPIGRIVESVRGRVESRDVFGLGAFNGRKRVVVEKHSLDKRMGWVVVRGGNDVERVEAFVRELLWEGEMQVYRLKGIVLGRDNRNYSVQGVRELYEIEEVDEIKQEETVVVMIGKDLIEESIQEMWNRLVLCE